MRHKILVGITNDNNLYFLELEKATAHNGYFSMSSETVIPLELEEAKNQSYESLKSLVEEETRDIKDLYLRDIDEIVQEIIDTDGNLQGLDTSLFPEDVEVNGETYIFESGSCGQHEEREFKKMFIDDKAFSEFMKLWKQYHLKELPKNSIAEDIANWFIEIAEKQDLIELSKEAIKIINNDNK